MFVMKKFNGVKAGTPKYNESMKNCKVNVNALRQICDESAKETKTVEPFVPYHGSIKDNAKDNILVLAYSPQRQWNKVQPYHGIRWPYGTSNSGIHQRLPKATPESRTAETTD
jgi:hypothetical protein